MEFIIREVLEEDWTQLLEIERMRYGNDGYDAYFLKMVPKIFKKSCLVAAPDTGNLIGYALGALEDANPTTGWLMSIAVSSDGKGIGTALTRALIDRLESLGASRLLLTVAPDNPGAKHIYWKLGFRDLGIEPDYYGPGAHRHVMERTSP